jgi:hypothetical protein
LSIFYPSILSTASSSSSKRCFTRILLLCQVFGLVLVVFSDSRSPSNPFPVSSFVPSFCSLGEYVSRPLLRENFYFLSSISSMPCQSLRISLLFLEFAISSFLSRTILVSNLVPLLPFLFSRLHFVFVSISSMSSLQYRRYILIRSLHVSQPSPPCIRLVIFNVFLTISSIHSNPSPSPLSQPSPPQYSSRYLRQCLPCISSIHSSIRPLCLTSVFPTFSSAIFNFLYRRLRQCTLVFRSYLLLIRLGAPSFYSPFSMSSLMSLRRLFRRRMRDRSRHFVYFKFVFSPSRPFGHLPLQLFNTYVESVLSMQFYSVPAFTFTFSSFTFSPFIPFSASRRRLDVHLSLTSGWVHCGWTHAGFRRCASSIGSVLIVSLRPLSPPGFLR